MPRKPKTKFTVKEKSKIAEEVEQFRRKEYLFRLFEEGLDSESLEQKEAALANLTSLYFIDKDKAIDLLGRIKQKFRGNPDLAYLVKKVSGHMMIIQNNQTALLK